MWGNAQIFSHTVYEEAVSHIWLCSRSLLDFLIYEENFFFSVCVNSLDANVFFFLILQNLLDIWPAGDLMKLPCCGMLPPCQESQMLSSSAKLPSAMQRNVADMSGVPDAVVFREAAICNAAECCGHVRSPRCCRLPRSCHWRDLHYVLSPSPPLLPTI